MKENLELFLLNQTKADVSISDLGIKVPASKTINVFKANPYLTPQQVEKSKQDGALSKRLAGENPVLKIVKKAASQNAKIVNKLKETTEPVNIKKTKSSIVIEIPDPSSGGDKLDFADYGVFDFEPIKGQDSVFISSKGDVLQDSSKSIAELKATKIAGSLNSQMAVIMNQVPKDPIVEDKKEPLTISFAVQKSKKNSEAVESKVKIIEEDGTIKVAAKKDPKNKKAKFNMVRKADLELTDDPVVFEELEIKENQVPVKAENAVVIESKPAETK